MPLPPDAPKLYLDCDFCDRPYLRENIAFVVFMRDRADADVHAIVAYRETGAGGYEYTIRFLGRGRFDGMEDQIAIVVPPDGTADLSRASIARGLRIGLSRFAARTRVGADLDVSFTPPAKPEPEHDPWNHWVMSLGANGRSVGESSYTDSQSSGSVAASRVTEEWKIRSSVYLYLYETRYDFGGGEALEVFRRDVGGSLLVGRSLGDHFTAGVRPSWSASTYTNIRSQYSSSGVLEWSVFPYSEATRRSVILQYSVRGDRPVYYEETIFGKEKEILFQQSARLSVDYTQPWGSVFVSVNGAHYLHDYEKAHFYSATSLNLKIVRGLSLTLFGTFSLLRNQLYLPKGDASEEEILLRRRQLATDYDYYSSVGLTYTFGSIYTPVVNTRLE